MTTVRRSGTFGARDIKDMEQVLGPLLRAGATMTISVTGSASALKVEYTADLDYHDANALKVRELRRGETVVQIPGGCTI